MTGLTPSFPPAISMQPNPFIQEIYRTRQVVDASGKSFDLGSEIDEAEARGQFSRLLPSTAFRAVWKLVNAYGLSSLNVYLAALSKNPRQVT